MRAYNIEKLPIPFDRSNADHAGWCFGLPPGIAPEQWPLDPATGYPLKHGFTIELPDDYRVHGPDIVAVSFFAIAGDHNDGGVKHQPGVREAVEATDREPPSDRDLLTFWRMGRAAHPRLSRMTDILGCHYAMILLSRAEYTGDVCPPPRLIGNRFLDLTPPPQWLAEGFEAEVWARQYGFSPAIDRSVYSDRASVPDSALRPNRALRLTPRAEDPNAGVEPRDEMLHGPSAYQPPFYWIDGKLEEKFYREHGWSKDHAANHIGGTMRPSQWVVPFSPFYIEFEEDLGGYNFGTGNAQLDFRDGKFDWACG